MASKGKAKPPESGGLVTALDELESALRLASAAALATLAPRVAAGKLGRLAKVVGLLGPDLELWFHWHDGQTSEQAIGPSENEFLLPAVAAGQAWQFLEKEGKRPWRPSWLPVMSNGAGDYVVCDRADGSLLRYYQHDVKRPKRAASLADWARSLAAEWRRVVGSAAATASPAGWRPAAIPAKGALAKRPDGTAFYYRATAPAIGQGIFYQLVWKQEADSWFTSTSSTLDQGWTAIANNLQPFQSKSDAWVADFLTQRQVFADGKTAVHAGLFEGQFARPPISKP